MGWHIGVHEFVSHIAYCGERDYITNEPCPHQFEVRGTHDQAQQDADEHYRWHSEKYRAEQEALDG